MGGAPGPARGRVIDPDLAVYVQLFYFVIVLAFECSRRSGFVSANGE
jgi:hypothetical protein